VIDFARSIYMSGGHSFNSHRGW